MRPFRVPTALALLASLAPFGVGGQVVFDWPIRSDPRPEVLLTGASGVFWNPGSLVAEVGSSQEVGITHVDGPDATGVRGLATSGVMDLPAGLRGGIGYWHLGLQGIPRTTTSPHRETGEIDVAEDVAVLALAKPLGRHAGIGGGLRFQRGIAGGESRSRTVGEIGVHFRSDLPLNPRLGLTLKGLGGGMETHAGLELSLPALASSRIPIHLGYGIQGSGGIGEVDHRISLRGSWMGQLLLGMGFSHLEDGNGWTPLWMLGADIGRYSLSVLREALANGFGHVHLLEVALRFP